MCRAASEGLGGRARRPKGCPILCDSTLYIGGWEKEGGREGTHVVTAFIFPRSLCTISTAFSEGTELLADGEAVNKLLALLSFVLTVAFLYLYVKSQVPTPLPF